MAPGKGSRGRHLARDVEDDDNDAFSSDVLESLPNIDSSVRGKVSKMQDLRQRLDEIVVHHLPFRPVGAHSNKPGDDQDSQSRRRRHDKHRQLTAKHASFWQGFSLRGQDSTTGGSLSKAMTERRMRKEARRKEIFGPVEEQYGLTINSQPNKHVMVLQYPDRTHKQLYTSVFTQKPLEMRIKPKCGLVEIDVPLSIDSSYNKEQGRKFGEALHKSKISKERDPFLKRSEMPNPPPQVNGDVEMTDTHSEGPGDYDTDARLLSEGQSDDDEPVGVRRKHRGQPLHRSKDEAMSEYDSGDDLEGPDDPEQLMKKFTLGGRIISFGEGDPIYMIATFQGDICTWTKVDAIVSLRAQFSHLDAMRAHKKAHEFRQRGEDRQRESRRAEIKIEDVNMMIKETEDPESTDHYYGGIPETMRLLQEMADEPWQSLAWVDRHDSRARKAFDSTLTNQQLKDAPVLVSAMTNDQYLDAISCPRVDPIKQGQRIMKSSEWDRESSHDEASEMEVDEEGLDSEASGVKKGTTTREEGQEAEFTHADGEETRTDGRIFIWKDGIAYGSRPKGKPENREVDVRIERICRLICAEPAERQEDVQAWLRKKKGKTSGFSFLNSSDGSHQYFLWRLRENLAGRGIAAEYDVPQRTSKPSTSKGARRGGRKNPKGKKF